ncbi:NAD(P)-dependent alcohol dehydrogenase [Roseibaca sp. Y0-43]|uniref:NAD(P)-dependent alcohol dehydrogenase n=1 Tax=Roseibaca sp. Y0-43 TaxID=2816854 RepID=UPI001D0C86A4|nr:NAD(P)-dependent alcohol dehydrogenase [Roseibaca sp. Y0-43]MCC1480445.1 NAD(P)-dependent alcohol dehydrogenase [Roseibaca sp. Y0-43]
MTSAQPTQIPQEMPALVRRRYGPPEVVMLETRPVPRPKRNEVLLRVHAASVNTADWRLRAGAFPGILAVPARAMFGILRPRNPYIGTEFAGEVVAVGQDVSRFRPGDRVFGIAQAGGASAGYLAVPQDGPIAEIPARLDYAQAAALPFGGLCALCFLADFARLGAAQRLLVIGASGGVGIYAVQIGKALGAEVTGVCGSANIDFIRDLGADHQIAHDLVRQDAWPGGQDVILDTIGLLAPTAARRLLAPGGQFFPLNFGLREFGAAFANPFRARKTRIATSPDRAEDLQRLVQMVEAGQFTPVIGHRFALAQAQDAHRLVETRHRRGAVVLDVSAPD